MKIARLGARGEERPVVIHEDNVYDLSRLTADIDGPFLAGGGLQRVREALDDHRLPVVHGSETLRVGAPIARPGAILGIGLNYAAHADETGLEGASHPIVFLKHPGSFAGPDDAVTLPAGAERLDWEVELGAVIGTQAWQLASLADAEAAVAGYTVVNDYSERDWQLEVSGGQWSKGKSAPGFAPTGPYLVPASEIDVSDLAIRSYVGGEPRQDGRTSGMVRSVAEIVLHVSQFMALEPGDLICTGAPQGVAMSGLYPYLGVGDVVELEIEGLGRQRQEIVAG